MIPGVPTKPVLALSISVTGKRIIPDGTTEELLSTLNKVLKALEGGLQALQQEIDQGGSPLSSRLSADHTPRLTLISGLADGVDQIAAWEFLGHSGSAALSAPAIERQIAAILPCSAAAYVEHSKVDNRAAFDDLARRCAYIVELDGTMPPQPAEHDNDPGADEARQARLAGFRAQGTYLLNHGDMLLAVDSNAPGRGGGTQETLRRAISRGTPAILHVLGQPGIVILESPVDLDEPVLLTDPQVIGSAVTALIDRLIGTRNHAKPAQQAHGYADSLLREYFSDDGMPQPRGLSAWLDSYIDRRWKAYEGSFQDRADRLPLPTDEVPAPYRLYRHRASSLSRRYSTLYRGSFLLGYRLAMTAVALAVLSLGLMLSFAQSGHALPLWTWLLLLVLGLGKLGAVLAIKGLADRAKHMQFAFRAADFRYLAERLRAMAYLPEAGSPRSPLNWSQPYSTRVETHGLMDHLFDSILRQADICAALTRAEPSENILRPAALPALRRIKDSWIGVQRHYHRRNHAMLSKMLQSLSLRAAFFGKAVIWVVVIELIIHVVEYLAHPPQPYADIAKFTGAALLGVAAILPALVAGLNGIGFQAEASKIADRSSHVADQLGLFDKRATALLEDASQPSLSSVLRLGEDIARLTLDEVAEWSAISGKEFVEM